ncbi:MULTISPECIES: glycosyltransferase family 2 protein [Flavobacteriaceae]|uniref:glycosyltransferase n=1 Tax=Flavobacteriaceae TaxID=49546 RepID=UPI0010AE4745|nr:MULTISPECIES: glycosyltransferase family 2 protein [Flavobacteriaceae]NJB36599.1 glycosyltransferase family 2 protein [Croceivirga sp. JEA036]TKD67252.1 glycosyltransferase family 2 protein [Flavobacterium sp. ASW18X]
MSKTTSKEANQDQNKTTFLKRIQHFFYTADGAEIFVKGSSLALMLGAIYLVYVLHEDFTQFNTEQRSSLLGRSFLLLALSLLVFKAFFFLYTLYHYIKYKAIKSVSDTELPTTTVIVPAYNEGKQVYDTLISLSKSDFPKEKLQIIAINDGSKDDTWEWMQKAKQVLGDQVEIYQQPKNMGKRHALYRGFHLGTGDVFVTVDSDSIVDQNTLRNLVSPFIVDNKCGAVAGNIRVLNNKKALLPKMLDVSFVLSFEFVRSAESNVNTVLCTPGALAAYKREVIFNCKEEWINQKFMGKPSDIGEDQALTNMVIKQGFSVLFQSNAFCYTNVPERYKNLYKMFIRWDRSNVREVLEMSKFVFTNFRAHSKGAARLLFTSQVLKIVMSYPLFVFMLFFVVTEPLLFIGSSLVSILILSSFSVIFYSRKYNFAESFWAYSYSIFYTFGLFWITPYSIATVSKGGWLTRGLDAKKQRRFKLMP